MKQRFGAAGKHGSIAATERAIWTLKCEWLTLVPVIRELEHLDDYSMTLHFTMASIVAMPALPAAIYRGERWSEPDGSAKTLPLSVEHRVFADTRLAA